MGSEAGPGMLRARSRFRPVYWVMRSIRTALVLFAISPASGVTQTPPGPAGHALATPAYRGFTPGISYRAFVERARTLADSDVVRCQTSPRTAQIMECGVVIRDPGDRARFYLSAHFVEGNADVVALYDSAGFGDARGVALVNRTKQGLTRVFGRPRPIGKSGWEWHYGRKVVRFSWRGRGTARWVSVTLIDRDVMDRIGRYARRAARRKP